MTTAAKLEMAERSLSITAKKVLDVVPFGEWWTEVNIVGELRRVGINMQLSVLQGCLKCLVAEKLVRLENGAYQRVRVHKVAASAPKKTDEGSLLADIVSAQHKALTEPSGPAFTDETTASAAMKKEQTDTSVLSKLAALSETLRGEAEKLNGMAKEIDDIAIEVEERLARIGQDTERLRQLRSILRSLNDDTINTNT